MKFSDDSRLQKKVLRAAKTMSMGSHVEVGILQDEERDGFSMTDLAMVHEYGSKDGRIPARSFIRSTCDQKLKKHLQLMRILEDQIFWGQLNLKQALTKLGEVVSKDMVQTINRGIAPDLAESTKKAKERISKRRNRKLKGKGFTPLIETGRLKGAITQEVKLEQLA